MTNLNNFVVFYQKITGTTSRLEKMAILREYQNDSQIREILYFLFNPFIVTGISNKKLAKTVLPEPATTCADLSALMQYFQKHTTGRDEDLAVLQKFVADLPTEQRDLVTGLIKKDLTLGANEKTINKVFGADFIPAFDVMLAERYADNQDYVAGKRFIVTEKLDGVRCLLIFNAAGEPTFFARSGKPFADLVELASEVQQLDPTLVYDGELLLGVEQPIDSADLYRLTVKVTAKDGPKKDLVYHIFDCLPKEDLLQGCSNVHCEKRKKMVTEQLTKLALPHVVNVPILYVGVDTDKIDTICDEYTAMGREGVMVNLADAPYECKRTKNLLKVKRFNTADVRVLGWEEGTGANKSKLGAVTVEFTAPDGKNYTCKVGSGFAKEEREYFFAHPDEIVGRIIEIGYFELSQNQNDTGYSLRFPTFKSVRHDKDTISMY